MTILVTGAAGFIGSHVTDLLLAQGHTVVGVDDFNDYYNPAFKEENIAHLADNDKFVLVRADVSDEAAMTALFAQHTFDSIIHLAAQAGVRVSFDEPLLATQTNIFGTNLLLELAHRNGVNEFIYASSSSVYGNQEKTPFSETDPVDHPVSIYAATKKANELFAYAYHSAYGMNCVGLRFFTVYGERGRPDMSPYLFADYIMHDKPLRRYGDGSMMRDFTYVGDIAAGVVACIGKNLGYEVINLGNEEPVTLNAYIAMFENIIGKKAIIDEHPVPLGDVKKTVADGSKAKKLLGWEPTTTLEDGLTRFIEWFKSNRANV